MQAFKSGTCAQCGSSYARGAEVAWGTRKGELRHADCSAATDAAPAAPAPVRDWSPMQIAVFDAVSTSRANLLIKAVAGSGKTTTIVEAARRLPSDTRAVFLAFNKSTADELAARLPGNVPASTFHGLCLRAYSAGRTARPTIDRAKLRRIVKAQDYPEVDQPSIGPALSLVGKAKGAGIGILSPDAPDVWQALIEHYAVDLPDPVRGLEIARELFALSNGDRDTIDFDDMLYFALADNAPFPAFDVVFVDESQDTNDVQRALLARMVGDRRLIAVGDERQAIYGFRGASSDAMQRLRADFDMVELPLSVSYRCPRLIVEAAQQFAPEIEASPTAPDGVLAALPTLAFAAFGPTDAVLCRNTAPLITLAYRLIGAGIGCSVKGRDIGQGLITLIDKMRVPTDLDALTEKLDAYRDREVPRLQARFKDDQADALTDKVESIHAAIGALPATDRSVPALKDRITSLFADSSGGRLTLSTVHKAKGLEWPTVYILDPQRMPSPYARQVWQQEQERNLQYVAFTRAQHALYLVKLQDIGA